MFYHAAYVTAIRGQYILRVGTRWPFSVILHREKNRMPGVGGQNTNMASNLRGFQLRRSGRSCSTPVSQLIVRCQLAVSVGHCISELLDLSVCQ